MDVFKFINPDTSTHFQQGEIINDLTSKMWVERYSDNGEFTFVGPANMGLKAKLPIGCFVSHVNTPEIMIVENHEIKQDTEGGEPEITISGRSYETFLEQRSVGVNGTFPRFRDKLDLQLAADYPANQAVSLISRFLVKSDPAMTDPGNGLDFFSPLSLLTANIGESIARTFPDGDVYKTLIDTLLKPNNLGIRTFRPGPWNPLGAGSGKACWAIHQGVDRSTSVAFAYDTGELVSADYIWSNKLLKNAAYVFTTWIELLVVPADTGYSRRWIHVDASDIDDNIQSLVLPDNQAVYDGIVAGATRRGKDAIAKSNSIAITQAEVSRTAVKSKYRRDYDLGDLVMVVGNYDETRSMRVVEYVEIEDENGESEYPTLSIDDQESS